MDELKLNQAKKTSPLNPSPEATTTNRMRFSSTSSTDRLKLSNEKINDNSGDELENSLKSNDSMSKSMSAAVRLRTPTPEAAEGIKPGVMLRSRNSITSTPVRPQSIHADNNKLDSKISPIILRTSSPSPILKPPSGSGDRKSIDMTNSGYVSMKEYNDLEEKVKLLEATIEKYDQKLDEVVKKFEATIEKCDCKFDEVVKKLQNEIDLRQQLKLQVDKLTQCVTQV